MSSNKITQIKELPPKIKEIKKDSKGKAISLEEEISEEDTAEFTRFLRRKGSDSSTLEQGDLPVRIVRAAPTAKEDEDEINFRPTYTGGPNPYQGKTYSAMPERAAETTLVAERNSTLQQAQQPALMAGMGAPQPRSASSPETAGMGEPPTDNRNAGRTESEGERKYLERKKEGEHR